MLVRLDVFGVRGWPGTALGLLIAALVVVVVWFAARYLRSWVQGELSRRRIHPEVVQLISKATFRGVVILGIVFVILYYFGGGTLGASGVLAATILAAMGVQDILRNYVSGVYLLTERRFNIGDEIEFAGHTGRITEIRFRVTYLRGPDQELIIVPNAELFNSTVTVKAGKLPEDASGPELPKPGATPASRKRRG